MKKLTAEQKAANQKARELAKDLARIEAEKNQRPVKSMSISIEWKNSRTLGANPHTSGHVRFEDGTGEAIPDFTCSGCGYDKESTVVADIFNIYLKYMLYDRTPEKIAKKPYGVIIEPDRHYFGGGIGMSSYYSIVEWLGGKLACVASGKIFDAYTVEF